MPRALQSLFGSSDFLGQMTEILDGGALVN
jgi:hypothetical protein